MNDKPVIPRELAQRDVEAAVDHYAEAAGEAVALRFIDDLERAYRHISRHPEAGSNRNGQELNLPGLRSWPLKRFPYVVFYVATATEVDVWRVLHAARDIPAWMTESSDT